MPLARRNASRINEPVCTGPAVVIRRHRGPDTRLRGIKFGRSSDGFLCPFRVRRPVAMRKHYGQLMRAQGDPCTLRAHPLHGEIKQQQRGLYRNFESGGWG
jgi:hypothetical protein